MEREPQPRHRGVLEGPAEDRRPLHGAAVVREPGGAGVGQRAHLGDALALLAGGDRGHEPGRHARLSPGLLDQAREDDRSVDDGARVRHREDRREPAGRGRSGARRDVLLVLVAGGPQVDVRIDEAGQEHEAVALDRLEICAVEARPDLGDHSLVDADIERVAVEARCRVDDAGAGDQEVGRGSRLRMRGAPSRHLLPGGGDDVGRRRCEAPPRHRPSPGRRAGRRGRPSGRRAPPATWSTIREAAESATSGAISTPRLIGPGCITSWLGRTPRRRDPPDRRVLASGWGRTRRRPPCARAASEGRRRRRRSESASIECDTSAPRAAASRGISVGGPTSVTCAPIVRRPRMLDRATRECSTSPTMATWRPSSAPSAARIV